MYWQCRYMDNYTMGVAPWPAPPPPYLQDDLFFMPGITEPQRTESARLLGQLEGRLDALLSGFSDFRADVAQRHRENQETIERLMNNIRSDSDRAAAATTVRVVRLEERVEELQTAHDKNAGAVAATRHMQKWLFALVPITIGIVEMALKILKV